MSKVAILEKIHPDGLEILKNSKLEYIEIDNYSEINFDKNIKDVSAIAIRTAKLEAKIMKECNNLRIVSRHGVGYDNVDLNYLNQNNIALAITGSANAISVAEHVMGMFLNLSKLFFYSDNLVRSGNFKKNRNMPVFYELFKKNIFIVGFGRIGKMLAKRCLGFDSTVCVYDPYVDSEVIKKNNCIPVKFDEGLKIADFISLHMPLNDKTKNIISKNEFLKMKKNCILVNTSRGSIINEEDMIWALENKIIFGAGLDVFENEPPNIENKLLKFENVVLTPHVAALSIECQRRMSVETCTNIVNFLNNSNSLNIENFVNRDKINLD